jgi:hypothetical protein
MVAKGEASWRSHGRKRPVPQSLAAYAALINASWLARSGRLRANADNGRNAAYMTGSICEPRRLAKLCARRGE